MTELQEEFAHRLGTADRTIALMKVLRNARQRDAVIYWSPNCHPAVRSPSCNFASPSCGP